MTATETFNLDIDFTATVNGTDYAIVSDGYNSFVVPAAHLEADADDDGEDAYTAWCEAGRVDEATADRVLELSAATDAVWDAACAARRGLLVTQAEIDAIAATHNVKPAWLARSAARHYLVSVL